MRIRPGMPDHLEGYGRLRPFRGTGIRAPHRRSGQASPRFAHEKLLDGLDAALAACELSDGATVSFHHHLRDGDGVLNAVMEAIARRGLHDIHVAATSIFPVHAPLVAHIRNGTVSRLSASFIAGPVGEAVSRGALPTPAVLRTHGGRARALETGELEIDAAFVAAPAADARGNVSGRRGRSPCGTMGYPLCDVEVAGKVVALTDCLSPYPIGDIDIPQHKVDFVAAVPTIGDAAGIVSGTTRPAEDPASLAIAEAAADVIAASGLLRDGFSLQTGAGGISLAAAAAVRRRMEASRIRGSFASGGITGFHVDMLAAGLFRTLLDVQCFDLAAVDSYRRDPRHQAMSAAMYANPDGRGAVVDSLDAVVLGAAEVDRDFNVNVTTKADGVIIGGSGGHADTAAGAKLTIVTTRLCAAGHPKIVEQVGTLTTPGETVDVVVTEAGLAINPGRPDLRDRLGDAKLPHRTIDELHRLALGQARRPAPRRPDGRTVAVSEYRDGSVTDLIPQL